MHGIKQKARRLSNELGATTKVAALRGAHPRTSRRHSIPIHVRDDSLSSQSPSRSRSSQSRSSQGQDEGGGVAGAGGRERESVYNELLEKERLRQEEREGTKEEGGGAPYRRRRASSTACLVS